MNISLEKLVPRVIVAGALGYCAWPSVSYLMSHPAAAPPATLPEVAKSALAPTITSPTRDPFVLKDAAEANDGSKAGSPRGQFGAKKLADAAKQKDDKASNPLSGLTLDATYLAGASRLAIINGCVYGPKETLPASKLKILDVLPYKVLLDCEGTVLTLAYSDTASAGSASTRSAPSRGKPSGGARPATRSASSKPKGGNK